MTTQPDVTPPPPDQQLSRRPRLTLVVLGCLALAFGGAGAAFAASLGDDGAGGTEDSAWVTVVEDDGVSRTIDCPAETASAADKDGEGL